LPVPSGPQPANENFPYYHRMVGVCTVVQHQQTVSFVAQSLHHVRHSLYSDQRIAAQNWDNFCERVHISSYPKMKKLALYGESDPKGMLLSEP
jgi:hypothetical protein